MDDYFIDLDILWFVCASSVLVVKVVIVVLAYVDIAERHKFSETVVHRTLLVDHRISNKY